MKHRVFPLIAVGLVSTMSSQAAVLITQYYEGSSGTNKWIEITNTGTTSVDLGTGIYKLSLWTNAAAENYKTNGTPSQTVSLTGTIAAGASFLYGNSAATPTPSYAVPTANHNTVINFNGNDSITLWTGATFATSSIVDAIGFTNTGNEGADTSFVRLNTNVGWNTTAGSNVEDFASVWSDIGLTAANNATAGTEPRLGYSAIPEPTAALLGSLGLLGLLRRRR